MKGRLFRASWLVILLLLLGGNGLLSHLAVPAHGAMGDDYASPASFFCSCSLSHTPLLPSEVRIPSPGDATPLVAMGVQLHLPPFVLPIFHPPDRSA